jgi:hypothetical protein
MKKNTRNKLAGFFLTILLLVGGPLGCPGSGDKDLMIFPFIVVIDSLLSRVFVIDNSSNRLNLVNGVDDSILVKGDDQPLLSDEDQVLYQLFPSNSALASLAGGVSRLFIIGGDNVPNQQVSVLDYSGGDTIGSSPISPIQVPSASPQDILVGIVVDPVRNLLFVTNASTGMLHFFDTGTGVEDPASPIVLGGQPSRVAIDLGSNLLAVADGSSTMIHFVDLTDLTGPVAMLDAGVAVRSLGMATNGNGSLLFLSGELTNVAKIYLLNGADLANSAEIFSLSPPPADVPIPNPLFITGSLNLVAAGNLTDGRMAGFYTQSTGDLLVLDVTQDLNTVSPNVILIGAVSGEGIAVLTNGSGQVLKVYFASPSSGVLSIVDPLTNDLLDQIN